MRWVKTDVDVYPNMLHQAENVNSALGFYNTFHLNTQSTLNKLI